MSSTTATRTPTPAHPRVRERRREVVRDAGKRRLTVLAIVLVVVALGVSAVVLAHSSLFAARHVTVEGATHTPAAAIVAASGLGRHPPLLDVGAANLDGVEALPWIASARLARHFPDSVTITVTERHPIVVISAPGGTVSLLDATGRVLSRLATHAAAPSGLVAVLAPAAVSRPGTTVSGATSALVRAAGALPVHLLGEVENLATERSLGVVVHLRDGAIAQLGTASDLGPKYRALATLLAAHALAPDTVADLRIPSSPVLYG